jgi:hypothetical protein
MKKEVDSGKHAPEMYAFPAGVCTVMKFYCTYSIGDPGAHGNSEIAWNHNDVALTFGWGG